MPGMGELDRGATFLRRIAEALREKKVKNNILCLKLGLGPLLLNSLGHP